MSRITRRRFLLLINFSLLSKFLDWINDTQIVYPKPGVVYCPWMPSFCHFATPAYNCEMNTPRQMPAITFSAALAGLQALGFDSAALLDSLGVSRAGIEDPF